MSGPRIIIVGVSSITSELLVGLQMGETMTIVGLPSSASEPDPVDLMESLLDTLLDTTRTARELDGLNRMPVSMAPARVPTFEQNLDAFRKPPQAQRAIAAYGQTRRLGPKPVRR